MKNRILNNAVLFVIISIFLFCRSNNCVAQETKIVFQDIEWSPSGDYIAFSAIKVKTDWSNYSRDKWKLYTYNLTSGKLISLCNVCIYFSISSDGKQIIYDKVLETGKDIFKTNRITGTTETVVANPGKDAGPSWSSDSQSLVYYSNEDGNEELYTFNLNNGEKKQLTNRPEDKSYNPAWSPVSNQIVYYLEKGDNKDQIYLTDSKGSFQRNLTNDDRHNIFPSWTPDGRIIYIRDKGEVMIMNADGTKKERLLEKSGGLATMSPDGNKVLFVSEDRAGLSILNLMSKKVERLFVSSELDIK